MDLDSTLPALQITATAIGRVEERFGMSVNLRRVGHSQYRNFDFNSMCVFNGTPLAANRDGMFSLDDSETDNGTYINSYVEFPTSDLGILNAKKFRKLYVGYETSGSIKITTKIDGNTEESFTLSAAETGQTQHRGILPMTRTQKGVYWIFICENVDGADFSLDNVEGIPVILTKGRR